MGILVCGLFAAFWACLVILGWHTDNQSLVQINPAFAPMQYNTALGFLLCGLGLIALSFNLSVVPRIVGACVFVLGILTLSQYIFKIDFGLDGFLMDPVFTTKTSHPGRPAPITALCFTLAGASLTTATANRSLAISFSVSVLMLSVLSLWGYLIPSESSFYGWGNLTRMAIHTAFSFVSIGLGLTLYSLWGRDKKKFDFSELIPFSLSVMVAVLTLFAWYIIDEETEARKNVYVQSLMNDTQAVLVDRYRLYEEALRGGLGLFYASNSVERKEWQRYVRALKIEENLPGMNGLGYIEYVREENLQDYLDMVRKDDAPGFNNHPETTYEDKFIIKFIEPVDNNAEAVGLDIGFEANRREAAEHARDFSIPTLTKKILLVQGQEKQSGFLLFIPVYDNQDSISTVEERRKRFKGLVYAPFLGSNFFKDVNKINKNQLYLEVFDGEGEGDENLIYVDPEYTSQKERGRSAITESFSTQMSVAGRVWTLKWHVSERFMALETKGLGILLLLFGLGGSAFLYLALGHLLRSKEIIHQKVLEKTGELKQALDFQDLIKNNIPDFMFVKDDDFKIIDANEAFLSIYPEEKRHKVIGYTTVEEYPEEQAEAFLEQDKVALRTGYAETTEVVDLPNGDQRTLSTKKVRFTDNYGQQFVLGLARDITDILKIQNKLTQSEAKLAMALDAGGFGFWEWDIKKNEVSFSPGWYAILGYGYGELPNHFDTWKKLTHKDDFKRVSHLFQGYISGAMLEYEVEFRMKHRDGYWVWILSSGQISERDQAGDATRIIGVNKDITDIKKEEERKVEAAKVQERIYEVATLSSSSAIWEWDIETDSLSWLGMGYQVLGYSSPEDLPATTLEFFNTILHPDDRKRVKKFFRKSVKGKLPIKIEVRVKAQNGVYKWYSGHAKVLASDNNPNVWVAKVYGILVDITEQKAMSSELVQSEERFRLTYNDAPIGIALIAMDGSLISTNQSFCRFLGVEEAELYDKQYAAIVHPEDRDTAQEYFDMLMDTNNAISEIEQRYLNADGVYVWGMLRVSVVNNEKDEPLYMIAHITDIGEMKRQEEQKHQTKKMESLGLLAGGIAHELNNILQPIVTASEILSRNPEFAGVEGTEKYLGIISSNVDKAGEIIDDILTFARVDKVKTGILPLQQTVYEAIKFTMDLSPSYSDIELLGFDTETNAQAAINKNDMIRIATNLLVNAIHAVKAGGGVKVVYEEGSFYEASAMSFDGKPGKYGIISFIDDGEGIQQAHLEKVFDPFYTTKDTLEGTGLGLPIVYGILKRWGGDIEVASEKGQGTEFKIYIPIITSS